MSTTLTFQDRNLDVIKRNGNDWVKGSAICGVLGYKNPEKAISDIYERHKDEFTPSMVQKLRIKTAGGEQEVLAFSLRGAHLLAMFSRTPVAKEFRHWVLDVLEGKKLYAKPQQKPSLADRIAECERLYGDIMTRGIMLRTILERQNLQDMHWHKMALSLSDQIVHVLYGISLHKKNMTLN